MNKHIHSSLEKFVRAADFMTAAQLFLQDNFMMTRDVTFDDVKPRLLGHWGSAPGVNFAYAHLSRLAKENNQDIMFVLGPGHAFPALQSSLFLEGTLSKFYPDITMDINGVSKLCKGFSWPYGYPSHSNPSTPGVILEGGELGYSLSTSYGAVMDNPDLVVGCLVGDGEAETGPLAGAWHLNKLINPKRDGTVLPILHLNGYKISAPTVFGRMSNYELMTLFSGYGYHPRIVDLTETDDPHKEMMEALDWAYGLIREAKEGKHKIQHMPMLVMRSLKGWTGPKFLGSDKIEGNCLAHQVVLTEAKSNPEQLHLLNEWLKGYNWPELFDPYKGFGEYTKDIVPEDPERRMGALKYAKGGDAVYKPLNLPDSSAHTTSFDEAGKTLDSSMTRVGKYLKEVFEHNATEKNFRFMSPDETYSNKLDAIFQAEKRSWQWPLRDWDMDLSPDGRVMEMLSEHNMQGLLQGYTLTGRHGVFASYEAFLMVVASMMDQYAKFLHHAKEIPWRGTVPSLNYILTSSGWRQDHNGFSHQNPGLVDDALRRQGDFTNVYLPPDANTTIYAMEKMLTSTREINLLCAGKTPEAQWLNPEQAKQQMDRGMMIWDFASDENPDIVMAAAGDYPTKEVMAAIQLIKQEWPTARVRCINVSALTSQRFGIGGKSVDVDDFRKDFTLDKPIIFSFHGYPETIKAILFSYAANPQRYDIRGYIEVGSTTTPLDMHFRNKTSRFDLLIAAFQKLDETGVVPHDEAEHIIEKYKLKIQEAIAYAKEYGVDLPEVEGWAWQPDEGLH